MHVRKREQFDLRTDAEVVAVRQAARAWAAEQGLSLVDQTKLVTAASELARNAVIHGGGGTVILEALDDPPRRGLRLQFEDQGPGIADIELAMKDGYSSGMGMGLGLGGSKRLVNDFDIVSAPGQGTRVTIARWK
jgi:serine/threonine-protein kinase RsbT